MKSKTCPKCQWVFPAEYPGRCCKFCKTPLRMGYCAVCGEWSESLNIYNCRCPKCHGAEHKAWALARQGRAEDAYAEWLERVKAQQIKALTEQEWLEACKYFNGCAYCGSDQIDARDMFISFRAGGRYCAWNIVPACEKCATYQRTLDNPFLRMDNVLRQGIDKNGLKIHGFTNERLQTIVGYLSSRMKDGKEE